MSGKRPKKTLACLLQALVGNRVVVELRNETEIRGRLDSVENNMKYDRLHDFPGLVIQHSTCSSYVRLLFSRCLSMRLSSVILKRIRVRKLANAANIFYRCDANQMEL